MSRNFVHKLRGEVENIGKNHNYIENLGRKSICGAVSLASIVSIVDTDYQHESFHISWVNTDMHFAYVLGNENARAAVRLYSENIQRGAN